MTTARPCEQGDAIGVVDEMSPQAAPGFLYGPAVDSPVTEDVLGETATVERMHAHQLNVVVRSADRGLELGAAAELIRRASEGAMLALRAIAHRDGVEFPEPKPRRSESTAPQHFPGYLVGYDFAGPDREEHRHVDYSYADVDEAKDFLVNIRRKTRPDLPWALYGLVVLDALDSATEGGDSVAEAATTPATAGEFGGDPRW